MRVIPDQCSVVVTGLWNPGLFAPPSLKENRLTGSDQIGVRLNLADPFESPEYEFDDLLLKVTLRKLQVRPATGSKENFDRAVKFAKSVVERFSQTPISAVGINLRFSEEAPSADLLRIFNLSEDGRLAESGLQVQSTKITRKLEASGKTINLSLEFGTGSDVTFHFNFHQQISSLTSVMDYLALGAVPRVAEALSLLKNTYNSDVQELEATYVNDTNPA